LWGHDDLLVVFLARQKITKNELLKDLILFSIRKVQLSAKAERLKRRGQYFVATKKWYRWYR